MTTICVRGVLTVWRVITLNLTQLQATSLKGFRGQCVKCGWFLAHAGVCACSTNQRLMLINYFSYVRRTPTHLTHPAHRALRVCF